MLRPLQAADAHDVVTLLEWMDAHPEREVFAPVARELEDLRWECEDKKSLVYLDDLGTVRAYAGLTRYKEGYVLEGPLSRGGLVEPVLRGILEHAGNDPIYAFAAKANRGVRDALETAGFGAMHGTDFFKLSRRELSSKQVRVWPEIPQNFRLLPAFKVRFEDYLELYRSSEDVWTERLHWREDDYKRHFARPELSLMVLENRGDLLGFAELETEGQTGTLAYLAVHPVHRGKGYGRVLLNQALREAFNQPDVMEFRARAHDHEGAARRLYKRTGFELERTVITYLLKTCRFVQDIKARIGQGEAQGILPASRPARRAGPLDEQAR